MRVRLFVLAFVAVTASAHPPVSVVVDRHGNAYYSDLHHVWRVAPDGTAAAVVRNVHTHELYLDAHGNLYGEHLWYEGERTDKWGHDYWRRSPDGRFVKLIADREGFPRDYSFVRDAAGNMYRASQDRKRVEKRAPDGRTTVVATGLKNIRWMIGAADGTLHLIDELDLVRIDPKGKVTRVVRKVARGSLIPFGAQHSVMGLWTDRAGNVYAASYAEGKVKRITPGGTMTVFAESHGGWKPVGGAFAPSGDLLLLEASPANEIRLRRIKR